MSKHKGNNYEQIRESLRRRRREILGNLGRLTNGDGGAASRTVGDRVDDAAFDLEQDSSYQIAQQEAEELREIDTALEKIEEGTYGICEECGGRIERPRLRALPYAVLCLKCKESEEVERAAGGY